ncbi:MAG TPA: ABC transporter substrate-binding protein [Stellaceae bacterium]|nr:ABC transporter substrate-binding protein [Stellaceae bacterium]
MIELSRRRVILGAGALASSALLGAPGLGGDSRAWAANQPFQPEKGAKLRLLRWSGFVQTGPEEAAFARQINAFTATTGVDVAISYAPLDHVPYKAMLAANIGAGPDLIWSLNDDAHLIPDKLVDVTDVANHLGSRLGGWYPVAKDYGVYEGHWICLPFAIKGYCLNYRISWLADAGFDQFPTDLDDFMRLAKRLKQRNRPIGLALGDAPSDANNWCYWLLWAFDGGVADRDGRVIINSPETIRALEYVRELYPHMVDGTLSWSDRDNNGAFLTGRVSCTNNPIVDYNKLVAEGNPMAADIDHAVFPLGRSGIPAEYQIMYPMMLFKYSRYPSAAKALMTFLMERPHYDAWLHDAAGYLTQTLRAYESDPVWTEDPKRTVFREVAARSQSFAFPGLLCPAASAVLADLIVVRMFAGAAAGRETPKAAAEAAEKRIVRHFYG